MKKMVRNYEKIIRGGPLSLSKLAVEEPCSVCAYINDGCNCPGNYEDTDRCKEGVLKFLTTIEIINITGGNEWGIK